MRRALLITLSITALVIACGTSADEDPLRGTSTDDSPSDPANEAGATPLDPAACEGPPNLEKMDPATLPPCCDGTAHCVPKERVPGIVRQALSTCAGGYCVPDSFLRSGGAAPPGCTAFNGAEGACMSKCVPEVGANSTLLQQGVCGAGELCAPCIHPLTQKPTGVCLIGKVNPQEGCKDAGGGGSSSGGTPGCPHTGPAVIDPNTLPACGDVPGSHCIDSKLVPPAMAAKLAPCDTGLCVPDDFIAAGGQIIPKTCTSLGGIEGRCLHRVLPDVASQADILPQATCGANELCAPCWHPADGTDTGACKLSCDPGPKQGAPGCPHTGPDVFDPTTFPSCGTGAHCLPDSLVPPAMASDLAACASGGSCVPDVFIKTGGRYVPKTCNSIAGAEGRCLHRLIPQIASQANLPQSTCASYERCAPCFNPLDGKDTGACKRSCDPGPTKPAYTFPYCCGLAGYYRGRCVPTSAIPDSQEPNLSKDVCTASGSLCVPSENLVEPFNPPSCSAPSVLYLGSYSGVCLSKCLQFSGLQDLLVKQGSCDSLHNCVPCYRPLGQPTGAPGCN